MSDHPECDRMHAVVEESNNIGSFLDWLNTNGIVLASMETRAICGARSDRTRGGDPLWRCVGGNLLSHLDEDKGVCEECEGTGIVERDFPKLEEHIEPYEHLLARYFEIDLEKVDAERRAMLKALQEQS